jgi:hypothetical protein
LKKHIDSDPSFWELEDGLKDRYLGNDPMLLTKDVALTRHRGTFIFVFINLCWEKIYMITDVAIIYKDKTWSLPKPNRHHHIIHQIHLETGDMDIFGEQGFLDEAGNFLDRSSALLHAKECNQLRSDRPPLDDWLFSENLW